MSSLGPGDKPAVVRKRAARNRKPQPKRNQPSSTARQNAAYGSRPARAIQAPKPSPQATRAQRAFAAAHGSLPQSRAISRDQYKGGTLAQRRAVVKAAHKALAHHIKLNDLGRAALQVHGERHHTDLEDLQNLGFLPRVAARHITQTPSILPINHMIDDRSDLEKASDANLKHHQGATADQVLNTAGPNDFDKVLAPLRKRTKASALTVLDQLDRPIHAIAGAAKEDVKHIQQHGLGDYLLKGGGKDALKAAGRGAANKDNTTFSDVLAQAGVHNKIVKAVAGFGLDVALDPTTYLTLGVGVPAKVAAKSAERAALAAGRDAVKAGEMTQAQLERHALDTAKKVYDAHPERAKHLGIKLGVRGVPVRLGSTVAGTIKHGSLKEARARAERQVMSAPVGTHINAAVRALGRGLTTEGTRAKVGDVLNRAGQQFIHDFRPTDIHPLEHDYIRSAARRYRTEREAGDRYAQTRARTLHKALKGTDPEDEATIIHAIEHGVVRNLPDNLRAVAEAAQRDLEKAGQAEIARGLRTTIDPKGPAPYVPPEVTKEDIAAARKAARDAVKAARQAEHDHAMSLQGYGVARGRAAVNSRQVGGTAAEREAEAANPLEGFADVAGGGHGMNSAADALRESTARVHALRLGAEDAKAKLGLTIKQHTEYQDAAAAALAHALKPEGYFPRHMKDDVWDPDFQKFAAPRSGGQSVTGTSLKARKRTEKISEMPADAQAEYDLRVPANVGRRLQEHGRAMALANLHDRMGALGQRINNMDELKAVLEHDPDSINRIVMRTPYGFKKLTNKRGEVDLAHAKAIFEQGLVDAKRAPEILAVPRHVMDHLDTLRNRGRSVGDLNENVILRGFDKTQGAIKTLQTAINPGYHGTNLVGDTFNARIGGALPSDFAHAARLKWVEMGLDKARASLDPKDFKRVEAAAKRTQRYGNETLSDADLVHEAIDVGAINTGFAGHELPELVKGNELKDRRSPLDVIRAASEHREDLIRLATYRGARKRGLSPDEAAEWVAKHHFDYGDLTEAERGFMRRIIPFYTFMARNTRLQVAAIGRAPGTLAAYGKAREEAAKAAGMDPDFARTLQEYEQQGLPIPVPGVKVGGHHVIAYPKLPIMDLNNLTNNPDTLGMNLLGRETVPAKVAMEQLLKTNTFTRAPYGKARVPAPDALRDPKTREAVNSFFHQLGVDPAVKDIEDPRTGKMVPGWSWRIDELLRQVPLSNLVANMGTESRNKHQQDKVMSAIGYLAGPRPQIMDAKQVSLNQLWDQHDTLKAQIKSLQETVHHKSGAKWKGKIGKMNERLGKLEVKIAKTSKSMGVSDPPFANRIGGKKKHAAAAKAFGSSGGGKKMFGAGG